MTLTEDTPQVNLRIITLQDAERPISISIPFNASVLMLKEKIHSVNGSHVDRQRVIFRGRIMKDNTFLNDYGVENGSTIHLVLRPGDQPSVNPSNDEPRVTNAPQAGMVIGTISVERTNAEGLDINQIMQQLVGSIQASGLGTVQTAIVRNADGSQSINIGNNNLPTNPPSGTTRMIVVPQEVNISALDINAEQNPNILPTPSPISTSEQQLHQSQVETHSVIGNTNDAQGNDTSTPEIGQNQNAHPRANPEGSNAPPRRRRTRIQHSLIPNWRNRLIWLHQNIQLLERLITIFWMSFGLELPWSSVPSEFRSIDPGFSGRLVRGDFVGSLFVRLADVENAVSRLTRLVGFSILNMDMLPSNEFRQRALVVAALQNRLSVANQFAYQLLSRSVIEEGQPFRFEPSGFRRTSHIRRNVQRRSPQEVVATVTSNISSGSSTTQPNTAHNSNTLPGILAQQRQIRRFQEGIMQHHLAIHNASLAQQQTPLPQVDPTQPLPPSTQQPALHPVLAELQRMIPGNGVPEVVPPSPSPIVEPIIPPFRPFGETVVSRWVESMAQYPTSLEREIYYGNGPSGATSTDQPSSVGSGNETPSTHSTPVPSNVTTVHSSSSGGFEHQTRASSPVEVSRTSATGNIGSTTETPFFSPSLGIPIGRPSQTNEIPSSTSPSLPLPTRPISEGIPQQLNSFMEQFMRWAPFTSSNNRPPPRVRTHQSDAPPRQENNIDDTT